MKTRLTKSKGNMYDWVTHTHSHLAGACSHRCGYCYVQAMAKRFPAMKERYTGDIRLIEGSLDVDYGSGNVIFIDHLNDLFAEAVPSDIIEQVGRHCKSYKKNQYVFQTKNPNRVLREEFNLASTSVVGTTIESDIVHECMINCPSPLLRSRAMRDIWLSGLHSFVTIEPVLDFNLKEFSDLLIYCHPDFVNIGADSKGHNLPEPSYEKIMELVDILADNGIEIRKKVNLDRLKTRHCVKIAQM